MTAVSSPVSLGAKTATPETPDLAKVGSGDITTDVTVDAALKTWLQGIPCRDGNCVQPNGTVHIDGFLGGWVVMHGAHPGKASSVKTWASGNVSWGDSGAGVKPLTVTFPVGAGKVLYTSYHTEPSPEAGFLPQERILQYLVFEL